jgi:hypothetical protein
MRPLRSLLPLVLAVAAIPAGADPFTPGARTPDARTREMSLEDFADRRRLEASLELRALTRDADRRREERWLRREGSPADVAHYRQRTRAEDDLDRLVARQEIDALPPGSGFERFQPETRRLLERSRIELRWIERRQELDLRLHELEREVEGRERPTFQPPVTTR